MIGQTKLCQTTILTSSCCNTPIQLSKGSSKLKAWSAFAALTALAFLLLLGATVAFGQSVSTGNIVGTITDPSGAVVPGADITITDKTTNAVSKTTTNREGHYVFVNVPPSTYDIKISKSGFQTALVQGQEVLVGQALTEDVRLPLGSVSQEITVETTGTELQTLNATVGNTVNGVALDSLPAIGGDVSTFVELQPGVAPNGAVAGAVSDQSTFQLDGGNNTSDMDGSMRVYTPSFGGDPTGGIAAGNGLRSGGSAAANGVPTGVMPTPADSIEEFKVNTANQTADFNSSAGAQVQVVTKRGTSAYHGTVYEYYLDNNFNANSWQNNNTGTPLPSFHYNRFGAAFGGPLIPKDVLGGKTYFFANYQGFRWPNSQTIEMAVPTANMRNGILNFGTLANPQLFNLNSKDPRASTDVANGINPLIQQFWNKYEPMPNDPGCGALLGSRCDGVNVQGFKANMAIIQNDNFGVFRLDHDFGAKWHFNSSYRYYKLTRATNDQVDIGGFFAGDTLGTPASLSNRPQVPWYLVAGLTTNITSNTTNDLHYSFLRNWWQWGTHNAPPQVAGLGGALEPLGEQQTQVLAPFNVNAQQVRTRFWDGMDHYVRDDLTMLHGNHLFSFGGAYQHNYNFHQRTDNGGGINYTTTYQLGDGSGWTGASKGMDALYPAGVTPSQQFQRYMASMLGIVTDSQVALTRSGANLTLNPPLTPAFDQSTIPYYNVYFSDSWHLKPSLTVTYGLGWTLEMPPTETNGKQVILVDSADQPIQIDNYIAQRQRSALAGQIYNPQIGFSLIGNTANSPKYPYDPFYGAFSPRAAVAWNPHFGDSWAGKIFGDDKTVIRAGYGRIYGRLNGVDLVLVPLLGTGLIQAVQCTQVYMPNAVANTPNGSCAPAGAPTLTAGNAFRVGVDGLTAPLSATVTQTLPQPAYPGFNISAAAAGTTLDPHTRPNVLDSFDFTIQRQLTNKMTLEVGYIGRLINHEFLPIDLNAVPYMLTMGGQSFESAYANIEVAMGCATSVSTCGTTNAGNSQAAVLAKVAPQPFLETALAGTGYCNGFANCTQALVSNEFSNLTLQKVWSLWNDLDKGGINGGPICKAAAGCTNANGTMVAQGQPTTAAGFAFPCSMLTCGAFGPLGAPLSTGFSLNATNGHGNYHAGFVTLRMNDYHGVTLQQNLTYGKALGTGAQQQSTSSYTADDPFNVDTMYGVQFWDRKYVYNTFVIYQPPYYKSQQGVIGHLLGGWNFSPIFTAGSGAPLGCSDGSNAQAFGGADGSNFTDTEGCLFNGYNAGNSANGNVLGGVDANTKKGVGTSVATCTNAACGSAGVPVGINIFANPVAVFDQAHNPILGINTRDGGTGPIRGLPYWNMDLSVRKNFRITERVSTEFQFLFLNVLNHMQFSDPTLNVTSTGSWGVLNTQGNNPRQMEFGLRVSF